MMIAALTSMLLAPTAAAQDVAAGRIGPSLAGQPGQRQTPNEVPSIAEPLARIDSRIKNRIQNRMRNRVDRLYDPQANALAPFAVTKEQLGGVNRPRRR